MAAPVPGERAVDGLRWADLEAVFEGDANEGDRLARKRQIEHSIAALGTVRRFGYRFVIFLPGPKGHGTRERPDGTSDARPEPDLAEVGWIGYAWPEEYGRTGNPSLVVLASGDILAVNSARYSGDSGPAPSAAMPRGKAMATTMDRPVATEGEAGDGSRWKLEP